MLTLNPNAFGRDDLVLFFHNREFTRKEVSRAIEAPDVAWLGWKLDGGITAGLWTKDRSKARRDLSAILGSKPTGQAFTQKDERTRSEPISRLELSLIDSLIVEPRISLNEVVNSTGLSPKTIRKHLRKLIETETIFIEPRLGALTDSGDLVYQIAISGKVSLAGVRSVMGGDAVLLHQTRNPPIKYMLCWGRNLAEVTAKTKALARLAGLESANISLNKEVLVSTKFARALIREEIRKRTMTGKPRG